MYPTCECVQGAWPPVTYPGLEGSAYKGWAAASGFDGGGKNLFLAQAVLGSAATGLGTVGPWAELRPSFTCLSIGSFQSYFCVVVCVQCPQCGVFGGGRVKYEKQKADIVRYSMHTTGVTIIQLLYCLFLNNKKKLLRKNGKQSITLPSSNVHVAWWKCCQNFETLFEHNFSCIINFVFKQALKGSRNFD